MKDIKKLLFLFCAFLSLNLAGQTENPAFEEISKLIEQKNFFKAKEIYDLHKNDMPETYRVYTEACLDNAFNRTETSLQKISSLIPADIPDTLRFKLYELKADNAAKSYRYKEAKDAVFTILDNHATYLTEKETDDFENELKIWTALATVSPQEINIKGDTRIKMKKDMAGLNTLKVSTTNDTLDFIFDTGANISTTSRSVAGKFNMEIIPVDIEVLSVTGKKIPAQLAVCKQMNLGNVEIRNAVFLVLEDENLSFPQAGYQIYGILGFPVIEAFKEIQITRDGYFIIPREETKPPATSNMAMSGLTPLININGKHFSFDTGADNTMLYASFYTENKNEIDKNYRQEKISFGGAGGKAEFNGFVIDHTFMVSGKKITLEKILLLKEKIKPDETLYGNIGQDMINQFDKMTLNFDRMFIKFE